MLLMIPQMQLLMWPTMKRVNPQQTELVQGEQQPLWLVAEEVFLQPFQAKVVPGKLPFSPLLCVDEKPLPLLSLVFLKLEQDLEIEPPEVEEEGKFALEVVQEELPEELVQEELVQEVQVQETEK
jgi:hypothetical protein